MTPLEEGIDEQMYRAQVAAVTAMDDLKELGSLTKELEAKLCRVVDAAQEVVNLLRGQRVCGRW